MRCHAKKDNVTTVYEDSHCSDEKPEDRKPCYLQPCEGVDWISGPWSGVSFVILKFFSYKKLFEYTNYCTF